MQPDGKLVAAGDSFSFQSPDAFAIARYNANGSLDTGFDADGKVRTDFGSGGIARGSRLQPDGKIVAAGVSAGAFALARYNSNGSLDTGFDGDGTLTTKLTSEWADFTGGAVRQPDGKLVVAGSTALEARLRPLPAGLRGSPLQRGREPGRRLRRRRSRHHGLPDRGGIIP